MILIITMKLNRGKQAKANFRPQALWFKTKHRIKNQNKTKTK